MSKRIMLKLSGEALSGGRGYGLDEASVREVGKEVKAAHDEGVEICVVIGGGNFWRGRTGTEIDRCKSDQIGMLGTVMNVLYVSEIFRNMGMETSVYTAFEIASVTPSFDKEKAIADLEAGKIVFFGGGTGHPFFSTDMGTVLRAAQAECDLILMAKSIDGVYDDDPAKNPNAKKYSSLSYQEILEKNLKVIDLPAAAFCLENKLPCKLFALKEKGSILRAARGEEVGTLIY